MGLFFCLWFWNTFYVESFRHSGSTVWRSRSLLTGLPTTYNLETEPYYDTSQIPINTFTHKAPLNGKVLEVKPLCHNPDSGISDICYIKLGMAGKMKYYEGQSIGVRPPGINSLNGKPHNVRLYSIASTRYGDDGDGKTISLCVRRNLHRDPGTQLIDDSKNGICSSFLCDSKPGQQLDIVGPSGKIMLLPESHPNADIIMVGTGTGIAPYRAFWRRLLVEASPAAQCFKGKMWLFHGVPAKTHLLFNDEYEPLIGDKFRATYALSREMTNAQGEKLYIQDQISEHAAELFEKMEKGAHIYFCGLKSMMPGIREALSRAAQKLNLGWEETLSKWKSAGQWHVEVY